MKRHDIFRNPTTIRPTEGPTLQSSIPTLVPGPPLMTGGGGAAAGPGRSPASAIVDESIATATPNKKHRLITCLLAQSDLVLYVESAETHLIQVNGDLGLRAPTLLFPAFCTTRKLVRCSDGAS